jgi:Uma2 family endonuclease
MTAVAGAIAPRTPPADGDGLQRFVFSDADWGFYEEVCRRVAGRRVFVTFYKGRLEVVTTSLLHELLSILLSTVVGVLAEELDIKVVGAGRSTLRRPDLVEGTEPDSSFYIAHQARMAGRESINLPADPPPDLAIEVEVTRRLGVRRSIYQDLGVPEIWVYGVEEGLRVLLRQADGTYDWAESSPTFKLLSLAELTAAVRMGQPVDLTTFTKAFRRQVRQAIDGRG